MTVASDFFFFDSLDTFFSFIVSQKCLFFFFSFSFFPLYFPNLLLVVSSSHGCWCPVISFVDSSLSCCIERISVSVLYIPSSIYKRERSVYWIKSSQVKFKRVVRASNWLIEYIQDCTPIFSPLLKYYLIYLSISIDR